VDLKKKIGSLISKYRKKKGLTQEKLASAVDMHPDFIGKIEQGKRIPSLESTLKILKVLKVKYSSFFKDLE